LQCRGQQKRADPSRNIAGVVFNIMRHRKADLALEAGGLFEFRGVDLDISAGNDDDRCLTYKKKDGLGDSATLQPTAKAALWDVGVGSANSRTSIFLGER
jgi:hypothetical protein